MEEATKKSGNYSTLSATNEQYRNIVECIRNGYEYDRKHRANNIVATAIVMEATLGIRISDIVKLRLCDIVKDGERYRLDIVEKKTGKKRTFTVQPTEYNYLVNYAYENKLEKTDILFPVSPRTVQRDIQNVCEYLGYERISTHSFRKYFATGIYEDNQHDIVLVQKLLQHSSSATTQRYIGISQERLEEALQKHTQKSLI